MIDTMSYPVVIRASKKKLMLLLVSCLIMDAVCVFTVVMSYAKYGRIDPVILAMCIIASAFLSLGAAIFLKRMNNPDYGLIIDKEGIRDNSTYLNGMFFAWKHVTHITTTAFNNSRMILIHIDNADEMIAQANGLKKKMMQMNTSLVGTPFAISTGSLDCSFDELLSFLNDEFRKRKGTHEGISR